MLYWRSSILGRIMITPEIFLITFFEKIKISHVNEPNEITSLIGR